MIKISITLLVFALALLAFGVYRAVTAVEAQGVPSCVTPQERDLVINLTQEAIDEAFQDKVKSLFDMWVRDTTEQPRRAQSGMATNLSAYHRARKMAIEWAPPLCDRPQ